MALLQVEAEPMAQGLRSRSDRVLGKARSQRSYRPYWSLLGTCAGMRWGIGDHSQAPNWKECAWHECGLWIATNRRQWSVE